MLPVQRSMFLIINPSDSSGSANLAIGVRQDANAEAGHRPSSPRSTGSVDSTGDAGTPVSAFSADTQPTMLPTARATLQARLPRVRNGPTIVITERQRTTTATSLIVAGGISAATSLGLIVYSLAKSTVDPRHAAWNENARIGGAVASGLAGIGCIATGVSLLTVPSANTLGDVEAQIQLTPPPSFPRGPVEMQTIVVEPNVVDTSASAAAQAASKPTSARWDAAAASAQLPFSNDHD